MNGEFALEGWLLENESAVRALELKVGKICPVYQPNAIDFVIKLKLRKNVVVMVDHKKQELTYRYYIIGRFEQRFTNML